MNKIVKDFIRERLENGEEDFTNEYVTYTCINSMSEIGKPHLSFHHCVFENFELELLTPSQIQSISFKNCEFTERVDLKIEKQVDLKFNDCRFKTHQISLIGVLDNSDFSFLKCSMKQLQFPENSNCQKLSLENCQIEHLILMNLHIGNIFIGGTKSTVSEVEINKITIDYLLFFDGTFEDISVFNSKVEEFFIQGSTSDIESFSVKRLILNSNTLIKSKISNFLNSSQFEVYNNEFDYFLLNNIRFIGLVSILNQQLYNCVFNALDFRDGKLSLDGSNISMALFSNISWPKSYLLSPKYEGNTNTVELKSLSEQYRQLKLMSANNGDKISSLKFYNHEMKTNLLISKFDKNLDRYDRLLLKTNKSFSDFGLSYIKPLKWLFSVHIVLFTLIVIAGYNDLNLVWPWNNNLDGIEVSLGQYVYLLNPLHKLPESSSGWILLIDFFMRLINSYFIYYFLKATRKFS